MIFREAPKEGLPVISAADITNNYVLLKTDVVIVGAGAAGSVVAYELAAAGKKVVLLEAGNYVPSTEFREDMADSLDRLYQDGGLQTTLSGQMAVLQGACVGGSSVVSATVAMRAPDRTLSDWAKDTGVKGLEPAALKSYYEKLERRLFVHLNESHEINECASRVVKGAEAMGWSWQPLTRAVKQCALTGHCLAGCATDRKMSALVTYLPWATAYDAQIYTNAHVWRVVTNNGRATAVEAEIIDPDTKEKVADLRVDANVVVLAAGAIQTPLILQRSEFQNLSGLLGRNLHLHPFVSVLGKFPDNVYGWRGALTGVMVDEFLPPERGGLLMQSGLAAPAQLLVQGEQESSEAHLRFMQEYKQMAALNLFVPDQGQGSVYWTGDILRGDKRIEWIMSRKDFDNFCTGLKHAARIFFAAGAEKVYLPTFEPKVVNSVWELDKVVDSISFNPLGLYIFRMASINPQGTCRMAADPFEGVVDAYGESHEMRGLFIADASLFPSGLTVNPIMTVMALANYVADNILKRADNYF